MATANASESSSGSILDSRKKSSSRTKLQMTQIDADDDEDVQEEEKERSRQDSNAIVVKSAPSPRTPYNSLQTDDSITSYSGLTGTAADETRRHRSIGDDAPDQSLGDEIPMESLSSSSSKHRDKKHLLTTISNKSLPVSTAKIKYQHHLSVSSSALQRQANINENNDEFVEEERRGHETTRRLDESVVVKTDGSDDFLFTVDVSVTSSKRDDRRSHERSSTQDFSSNISPICAERPPPVTVKDKFHSASKTTDRHKAHLSTIKRMSDDEFVTIDEDEDFEEQKRSGAPMPPGRYCVRLRKKSTKSAEKKTTPSSIPYESYYDADGDTNTEAADDEDEDEEEHSQQRSCHRHLRKRLVNPDKSTQSQPQSIGHGKATLTPVLLTVPGANRLDAVSCNKNEPVSPTPSLQTSSPSSSTSTSSSSSSFSYTTHVAPSGTTTAHHLTKAASYTTSFNSESVTPTSSSTFLRKTENTPTINLSNTDTNAIIALDPTIVSATSAVSTKIHKIPAFQVSGDEKTARSNASMDQTVFSFVTNDSPNSLKSANKLREYSFDDSKKIIHYEDPGCIGAKAKGISLSKLDLVEGQSGNRSPNDNARPLRIQAFQTSLATIQAQDQNEREPVSRSRSAEEARSPGAAPAGVRSRPWRHRGRR